MNEWNAQCEGCQWECQDCKDKEAENARLRAELAAEKEKHRWIPVTERLPKKNDHCIVAIADSIGVWVDARYYRQEPVGWDLYSSKAICWQPLPEPPETQP